MSAHDLLNLLNELGKPRILSLFRNKFNKFINTGAGMLDSIYYMTLKLHCTLKSRFLSEAFAIYTRRYYGHQYMLLKSVNHKWFINLNA